MNSKDFKKIIKEENLSKGIAHDINISTLKKNSELLRENKDFRGKIKSLEDTAKEKAKKKEKEKEGGGNNTELLKKIFSDGKDQGVVWVKEYWERVLLLVILGALEYSLTRVPAGIEYMKNLADISKDFLPQYFFMNLLYIVSIIIALTFFLPTAKLRNATKGLKRFEIKDLNSYITKFEEIHNEIKETEELESDFSKKLSKRSILKKILSYDEIRDIESEADIIWITSKNLKLNTKPENIAFVKENLVRGAEYHWFVPEDIDDDLIEKLEKNFIDDQRNKLKGYFFHKIPRQGWMLAHNVVVFNHGNATKSVEAYEFTFKKAILRLPSRGSKSLRGAMKKIIIEDKRNLFK